MVNDIQNSLKDFYCQEIISGIERIDNSLSELEAEPGKREYLRQIKDSAQSISDLAMIHGFEGVEAIADKIIATTISLLSSEADLDKSYSTKVKVAITTLRQVFQMEDDMESLMSVDKFDKQIEFGQKKVQAYTERLSDSFNRLSENQLELPFEDTDVLVIDTEKKKEWKNVNKDDVVFDIREIDDLLKLDVDEQDEDIESYASVVNIPVISPGLENEQPENRTDFEPQQQSIKDHHENLKQLFNSFEQAVYELQIVPFAANAVHELRTICSTLYTSAQQLNDNNLKIIAEPLQKLTHEKIAETEPLSESILELLNQSIEILHHHLDLNLEDEHEIQEFVQKIDQVLEVESVDLKEGHCKIETELENRENESVKKGKFGKFFKRLIKRSHETSE